MFIITYKISAAKVDEKIELLQINDIFNVFYESPLEITTDNWGYGFIEKDNELIDFKIAYDSSNDELNNFIEKVNSILKQKPFNIKEENYSYDEPTFEAIHLNDEWVLASPNENIEGKKKINFISQGAFGTGLHETTQDILKLILSKDFSNLKVLDIGTGSGILSLATSLKGAKKVTALDIRDVKDEVLFNASLNNITNIEPLVCNALSKDVIINEIYDFIYINIGGEETQMFMDFINDHITLNGKLLVSGLVEWSFDFVKNKVEEKGYLLKEKYQTNEWCTAIFDHI